VNESFLFLAILALGVEGIKSAAEPSSLGESCAAASVVPTTAPLLPLCASMWPPPKEEEISSSFNEKESVKS
jgi:hypothetical protein